MEYRLRLKCLKLQIWNSTKHYSIDSRERSKNLYHKKLKSATNQNFSIFPCKKIIYLIIYNIKISQRILNVGNLCKSSYCSCLSIRILFTLQKYRTILMVYNLVSVEATIISKDLSSSLTSSQYFFVTLFPHCFFHSCENISRIAFWSKCFFFIIITVMHYYYYTKYE